MQVRWDCFSHSPRTTHTFDLLSQSTVTPLLCPATSTKVACVYCFDREVVVVAVLTPQCSLFVHIQILVLFLVVEWVDGIEYGIHGNWFEIVATMLVLFDM